MSMACRIEVEGPKPAPHIHTPRTHPHTRTCTRMHERTDAYMHAHPDACTCMYTHVHAHVRTRVQAWGGSACVHVCMRACVRVRTRVFGARLRALVRAETGIEVLWHLRLERGIVVLPCIPGTHSLLPDPINRSIDRPINQIDQSNRPIDQSTNRPIAEGS